MRALRIGDKGPAVRRLQELGDLLGYDSGPNDGLFGPVTLRTVKEVQEYVEVEVDGIAGPLTFKAIFDNIGDSDLTDSRLSSGVISITHLHLPPKNFAYLRSWQTINGVVLHQTGCEMSPDPYGWSRVNAHFGITQEGVAILINNPLDMIWHARRLSRTTIGVEVEGNYCGLMGRPGTLWARGGGPHTLNSKMIDAADSVFAEISHLFRMNGIKWEKIFAHRQSAGSRRRDPGEEIWRHIGRDWIDTLGISDDDMQASYGTGRIIPEAWDRRGEGDY